MSSFQKFPVELWLVTMKLALGPYTYDSSVQSQLFNIHESVGFDQLLERQSRRKQLLTICKFLYPLVERILYSDVIIRNTTRLTSFLIQAMTLATDQTRRGEWTRGLRVELIRRKTPVIFKELMKTCPNLISLHVGRLIGDLRIEAPIWDKDSMGTLRYLTWENGELTWDHLREIARHDPHLTQLRLIACDETTSDGDAITLSSVTHLTLSAQCAELFPITKLRLPSLQSLRMEVSYSTDMAIFNQHGASLRQLELLLGDEVEEPVNFPHYLFELCPNLQKLIFNLEMFEPPEEVIIKTHTSLVHLTLEISIALTEDDCSLMTAFSALFRPDIFPNLHTVTVVAFDQGRFPHSRELVSSYFPHASVDLLDTAPLTR